MFVRVCEMEFRFRFQVSTFMPAGTYSSSHVVSIDKCSTPILLRAEGEMLLISRNYFVSEDFSFQIKNVQLKKSYINLLNGISLHQNINYKVMFKIKKINQRIL